MYRDNIMQLMVVNAEETSSTSEHEQGLARITAREKSLLLALALKWRQQSDNLNSDQIQELEREIWLSHIHSTMKELQNSVSSKFSRHAACFYYIACFFSLKQTT